MIETRVMNDEERKELEGDVKPLKWAYFVAPIGFMIFTIFYFWIKDLSEHELYGIIIIGIIIVVIYIAASYWEVKSIQKDIENGTVEVIKGVVTKETKLYKFRKYEIEIDHEIVDLGRPIYLNWLKKGNEVEIVRAPLTKNICKVVTNGEVVYPF